MEVLKDAIRLTPEMKDHNRKTETSKLNSIFQSDIESGNVGKNTNNRHLALVYIFKKFLLAIREAAKVIWRYDQCGVAASAISSQ